MGFFMAYRWGVILTTYTSTGMWSSKQAPQPLVAETKNAWMVGEVKIWFVFDPPPRGLPLVERFETYFRDGGIFEAVRCEFDG